MHRIDTPTAQADKFGPGKNGFTNGDPATGRRATDLNSDMWDAVQEEICTVIEKSGLALNKDQHDQLHQAIVKIITSKIPDALLKKNNLSDLTDKVLALANIGGVPKTLKVNGNALSKDINIPPSDIFRFSESIGSSADLNNYTEPGLYFQPMNAQAQTGKNYPEANAGSLEVYKHAGVTQIYRIYSSSRSYIRTMYSGAWSAWTKQYDAANKPSPADIGAVNKGGDTMSGTLKVGAEVQSTSANSFRIAYGSYGTLWRNDGNNLYLMLTNKDDAYGSYNSLRPLWVNLATGALQSGTPLTVSNTINADKEITAGYSGAFAWVEQYKTRAPFFNAYSTSGASEYHPVIKQQATIASRNSYAFSMGSLVAGDELSWHLHMKGSGGSEVNFKWDTKGNFNAPGQVNPGSYANFDSRYYTKAQSDAGYMPRTGAYTKAESDGRFQPKGSYTPAGQAYTKAESDSRYNLKNTATKSANAMTHKDASTGVMEVVMSNITVTNNTNVNVTFPTAFPNACVGVVITYDGAGHGSGDDSSIAVPSYSRTGCVLRANNANGKFMLIAKGY